MGREYTEAQKRAIYKNQEKYVKVQIQITPDKREEYKRIAESNGISLTKFIIDCIEKEIENSKK